MKVLQQSIFNLNILKLSQMYLDFQKMAIERYLKKIVISRPPEYS